MKGAQLDHLAQHACDQIKPISKNARKTDHLDGFP